VTLKPVPLAEKATLRALFNPYLIEHADLVDPQRRYGDPTEQPFFDLYWREPQRAPLWIMAGEARAGFVLLNAHSPSGLGVDRSIAEFYVQPDFRRHGVGAAAVREALCRHPGQWELQVYKANSRAMAFWPQAIEASGASDWERIDLGDRIVHRFRMS
jgi:predicted acetyltransferase